MIAVDAEFSFRGEVTMFKIRIFIVLLTQDTLISIWYPATGPHMFFSRLMPPARIRSIEDAANFDRRQSHRPPRIKAMAA
jgi:hypothetical protein